MGLRRIVSGIMAPSHGAMGLPTRLATPSYPQVDKSLSENVQKAALRLPVSMSMQTYPPVGRIFPSALASEAITTSGGCMGASSTMRRGAISMIARKKSKDWRKALLSDHGSLGGRQH